VVRAFVIGVPFGVLARRNVQLTTDDGFDPCGLASSVEVDDSVHATVVGDSKRVHSEFLRARNQPVDTA